MFREPSEVGVEDAVTYHTYGSQIWCTILPFISKDRHTEKVKVKTKYLSRSECV